jgi:hypothetical protein
LVETINGYPLVKDKANNLWHLWTKGTSWKQRKNSEKHIWRNTIRYIRTSA